MFSAGPDFMHVTVLLVDMRVYLIFDWLAEAFIYLLENPEQNHCDLMKKRSMDRLIQHNQIIPGQQAEVGYKYFLNQS